MSDGGLTGQQYANAKKQASPVYMRAWAALRACTDFAAWIPKDLGWERIGDVQLESTVAE